MTFFIWLAITAAVVAVWARIRSGPLNSHASSRSIAPSLPTTGKCFREVVGESHYQPALKSIAQGKVWTQLGMQVTAMLVLEDDNKFDKNAVRIDIRGQTVGYLATEEARLYRGRLKRAKLPMVDYECPAAIVGGGSKHYGVWLDLPDRLGAS